MKKLSGYALLVAAFLGLISVPTANAITISLDDASTPGVDMTVTDGDGDGIVFFSGAVGSFGVNMTTGVTEPALGSKAHPALDLNSINIQTSGSGTLDLSVTHSGYTGLTPLQFDAGGTTNGTISLKGYMNSILIGTLGTYGVGAWSGTTGSLTSESSPYSLTITAHIVSSTLGATSFNAEIRESKIVPEPGTILLLGAGLLGMIAFRKRVII